MVTTPHPVRYMKHHQPCHHRFNRDASPHLLPEGLVTSQTTCEQTPQRPACLPALEIVKRWRLRADPSGITHALGEPAVIYGGPVLATYMSGV